MAESVLSERAMKKLVSENYVYTLSKRTKDDENGIWVCEKRGVCKGRVWTVGLDGEVVKIVKKHNHPADASRKEALKIIDKLKDRARETLEQPQQILAASIDGVHANVVAKLSRIDSMKRTIRYVRNRNGMPPLPTTLEELVLPQYQEITINGRAQRFLMFDSGDELAVGRMLIFSTPHNLNLMARSREWFADGTFSTAPHLFGQLYTIHVTKSNCVFPVIYALLPNKSRETYVKLLQEVKRLQPGLRPNALMTDFELAALQAFSTEFPQIEKTACFFHLTQNVWKHVQSAGLKVQYQQDHEFALWIRMIPSLAFVPEADVINAFEQITENENFPETHK